MKFSELVAAATTLVEARGRITYRALQLEFDLDDTTLAALRDELLFACPRVTDVDGRGLAWATVDAADDSPPPRPTPPVEAVEEYRHLSLMFCDLVGSTGLAVELDTEVWQAALGGYHRLCHDAIAQFGGHIAQYLGDGVLAYFGFPVSHEDDPVRAVEAGLEILSGRARLTLPDGRGLALRIGIHTGPVMVAMVGAGARRETLAVGETPNLAARLQATAAPDTLVVSQATARLIAGRYELRSSGARQLAGIEAAVEVFEVGRGDLARSAFDAARSRGLTPVVGREHETGFVLDRAGQVREGKGQALLIIGEAGIGKSRLVLSARELGGVRNLEFRCSAHFQHSALYPLVHFLERSLAFERDETAEERLAKIRAFVLQTRIEDEDAVALLAALLSIPETAGYVLTTPSPSAQRQRTLALLGDAVLGMAESEALCVIFEDLHWADPSTLEFLGLLIAQSASVPLLLLMTARPEFEQPWPARSHLSQLMLGRLSPSQVVAMIGKVADGRTLPGAIIQQILVKTDGVPLFVEELTKTIIESGQLRGTPDGFEMDGDLLNLAIPDTLQDSLQARLVRLDGAREIAQYAAVIGRDFSRELLQAVAGLEDAALDAALARLLDAELVFARGRKPHVVYQFKHALVQDAAYQSLLRRTRQELHARVVSALTLRFPESLETQPEVIAHHLTEAGEALAAVPCWLRAGQRALQRSANVEAVASLRRGLAVLESAPQDAAKLPLELSLLMALAPALMVTRGYAHGEVDAAYTRVRDIAHVIDQPLERFRLLYGLWLYYANIPDYRVALELSDALLEEAALEPDVERIMLSEQARGVSSGWMGRFADARTRLEKSAAHYDPHSHSTLTFHYGGLNPGTFAELHAAVAYWHLGYPERALARCESSIAHAEEVGQVISLAHALVVGAWIYQLCGFDAEAAALAERGLGVASGTQSAFWIAWAQINMGAARHDPALVLQGAHDLRATGGRLAWPMHMQTLGAAYLDKGAAAQALTVLDEGIAACANGEEIALAELHRLRAEACHLLGRPASEVLGALHEALAVARRQQARAWELRALTSLVRHLAGQPGENSAKAALAELVESFSEGQGMRDLREARAILQPSSA